jgi:hypothetical protein
MYIKTENIARKEPIRKFKVESKKRKAKSLNQKSKFLS